jgi:hypothetical protein
MKIRLSELRQLVKSIINEQSKAPKVKTYSTPKQDLIFKTSNGKLYTHKSNFKDEGLYSIIKEEATGNGIVKIYYKESNNPFYFSCEHNAFNHDINGFDSTFNNFHNVSYARYLRGEYCLNAMGAL